LKRRRELLRQYTVNTETREDLSTAEGVDEAFAAIRQRDGG